MIMIGAYTGKLDCLGWSVVSTATEEAAVSTNHTGQSIILLLV